MRAWKEAVFLAAARPAHPNGAVILSDFLPLLE
jgi:hypothetical protein